MPPHRKGRLAIECVEVEVVNEEGLNFTLRPGSPCAWSDSRNVLMSNKFWRLSIDTETGGAGPVEGARWASGETRLRP